MFNKKIKEYKKSAQGVGKTKILIEFVENIKDKVLDTLI